jgi:hypothetical protein
MLYNQTVLNQLVLADFGRFPNALCFIISHLSVSIHESNHKKMVSDKGNTILYLIINEPARDLTIGSPTSC